MKGSLPETSVLLTLDMPRSVDVGMAIKIKQQTVGADLPSRHFSRPNKRIVVDWNLYTMSLCQCLLSQKQTEEEN